MNHYHTDNRTQQMCNDAVAQIEHHTRQKAPITLEQTQKELNLYYKQMEALDKPIADAITAEEKQTLNEYYKHQIRQRLDQLDVFIKGLEQTARAINIQVFEPETIS